MLADHACTPVDRHRLSACSSCRMQGPSPFPCVQPVAPLVALIPTRRPKTMVGNFRVINHLHAPPVPYPLLASTNCNPDTKLWNIMPQSRSDRCRVRRFLSHSICPRLKSEEDGYTWFLIVFICFCFCSRRVIFEKTKNDKNQKHETSQGFVEANEHVSGSFPSVLRKGDAKGYGLFCGPRPARCVAPPASGGV